MAERTIDSGLQAEELIEEGERDLGFGSVVAGRSRLRFLNQDGSFNVERTGLPFFTSLNLYHIVLTMTWPTFLGIVLALYFLSNIVFGSLYALIGDGSLVDTSADPMTNTFLRSFFFSVQTFATIGYGTIHPVGVVPNLLVTVESYYSLLANALITGVVFARFARPTAKIVFSECAVIAPYRGKAGLMFRLVNGRSSQMIDVEAKVMFARFCDENGAQVRKFDALELERRKVAFFPLSWTVVHPIDENSPMWRMDEAALHRTDAEIVILLSAMDETFSQVVNSRTSYKADQIRFGSKFINIYNEMRDDQPISIDVRKLSLTERAELGGIYEE